MTHLRRLACTVLICLGAGQFAWAQPGAASPKAKPALDRAIRTLFSGITFDQTAISPDGKQIAWVESAAAGASAIYVAPAGSGGQPRRVTAAVGGGAGHAEDSIAWSPDSKRLAFLSDALKPGQTQLYVAGAAGGVAIKLTNVKGFLASPGWSPDGKTIAVLFTENAERAAGPLVAEKVQTGVIQDAVTEQRLALVNANGGALRQISPADTYVYEFDWSPDGKRFVTTGAHGNGDDN